MITRDEAIGIAEEAIKRYPAEDDDEIIIEREPREESFGWVFFYNSRRFLDTGDDSYALTGNAPVVVMRETGEVRGTGTAKPLDEYLDEFRKRSS